MKNNFLSKLNLLSCFVVMVCSFVIGTSSNVVFGQSQLPYTDNFSTNNGWTFSSNNSTIWVNGSATGNSGNSMYVSQNGGVSNTYGTGAYTQASKTFSLPAGQTSAVMSFDVKMRGEGSTTAYDYLNVWVFPIGATLTTSDSLVRQNNNNSLGGVRILTNYRKVNVSDSSTWFNQALNIPTSFNGSDVRIVYEFRSDGTTNNKPAPAIDNLSIAVPTCPNVTDLVASNVGSTSVALTFTNTLASQYLVYVNGAYHSTINGSATINNLVDNTPYNISVKAFCAVGDTSYASNTVSFTTTCLPVASFYEDFGTTGSALPACFERVGTSGSVSVGTSNAISGNRIEIWGDLVLKLRPVSNMGAGTHRLRIHAKPYNSNGGKIYVGYLTNPNDRTSFVKVDSLVVLGPTSNPYAAYSFNFPVGINATNLAIKTGYNTVSSLTAYADVYIDDIYWEPIPSCISPTNVVVSNYTDVSADIAWVAPASAPISYFVYLNGVYHSTVSGSNTSTTISQLTQNTNYTVSLRAYCGGADTSFYTSNIPFTTSCTPVTSFYEDFGTTGSALPACFEKAGTQGSTVVNTTNSISGNRVEIYGDIVLKLKPVSNMGAGTHRLRMYVRPYYATYGPKIYFGYLTNPNDRNSFVKVDSLVIPSQSPASYVEKQVYYPAGLSSQTLAVKTGYNTLSSTSSFSDVILDDIYWEPIPSCLEPTNVQVTNFNHNSANLTWTPSLSGATSYSVYVNGVYHSSVNTNSINLVNLTSSTLYNVQVNSLCALNDSSVLTQNLAFTTTCTPVALWTDDLESYNTSVVPTCYQKIGTTGTVYTSSSYPNSGSRSFYMYAASGAESYLQLPPFSNINAGTNRLRFTLRTSSSTYFNTKVYVGYLTVNNDPSSFVVIDSALANSTVHTSYTIYPPVGTVANNLVLKTTSSSGAAYAYMDDFNWELIPSCVDPTGLASTSISNNSASFIFNQSTSNPSSYLVYVNGVYHSVINDTIFTLSGLTSGTAYQVSLASLCSNPTDTSLFVSPLSFTTDCDTVTTFYEGFENSSTLPICFEKIGTLGSVVMTTSSTQIIGTRSLNFYGDAVMKLKDVNNLGSGTHRLRLKAKTWSSNTVGSKFAVGYLTDPTDRNTFVVLDTINVSTYAYSEYIFYPQVGVYTPHLAFKNLYRTGTTFSDNAIDDIYWEPIPSCVEPQNIVVSNITNNTAVVNWVNTVVSPASYSVYVDGIFHSSVQTDSIVLTGLNPQTVYNISITSVCSVSDSSTITAPVSFTTLCDPISADFCEDFTTNPTLGCWTVNDANGDSDTWVFNSGAMRIYTDFNAGNNNDYLISPQVILGNNKALKFSYKTQNNSESDSLRVLISTTGNAPSDFTTQLFGLTFANSTYQDTIIDLSAFAGQSIYIAFHVPPSNTDGYYLYVDDVCIKECMPNAGNDQTISVCISNSSVDLTTVVSTNNPNGYFIGTDALTTTNLNNSIFTFNSLPMGSYNLGYVVEGLCTNDTLNVTVNVENVFAFGNTITGNACSSVGQIDLETIQGVIVQGGVFTANNSADAQYLNNNVFDYSQLTVGTYSFTYIASNACNTDTVGLDLTVILTPSAGNDVTLDVCKNQPISLNALRDPNGQSNGIWFNETGQIVPGGNFNTGNNLGVKKYYYIINSIDCGNDTSVVTLNVLGTCDYLGFDKLGFEDATLYPNPTSSDVTIRFSNNEAGVSYSVVDVNGRIVENSEDVLFDTTVRIDLTKYEKGVYMIKVYNNDAQRVFRVIKE